MSSKQNERGVRHIEFPISKPGGTGDQTFIGVMKRVGTVFPIQCTLYNDGDAAFTLTPMHSDDNGVAEPFSPLTLRVDGAAATTVTANPRSIVPFTIERGVPLAPIGTINLTAQPSDEETIVISDGTDLAVAATGSIIFEAGANPTDTETITIDDGTTSLVFEFDDDATTTGDVAVTIGVDGAATLAALKTAINASALTITASDGAGDDPKLILTFDTAGTAGNSATVAEAAADITVTANLSGGAAATDAITFEFDDDASATGTAVTIGADIAATEAALIAAINASALTIVAAALADGSIGLYNTVLSTAGNVTITETGAAITVTGMAGGAAAGSDVDVKTYTKFNATAGAYGRLIVEYRHGEIELRNAVGVP